MRTRILPTLIAGLFVGLASTAMANPMHDVCHLKAENISGYSGDRGKLNLQVGRVNISIRGSFAIGLSHSSGPKGPRVPAGAGQGALEMQEMRAMRKYKTAYARCIQTG